ncbi:uncharacterized protein LOC115078904 [Rhinatrema bivittatum]|uniref:uncharacterized protein LOC115078904 n=1 Tax=Rhinatrema bivittatum TaxID=194408 RepID=UPI00112B1FBC|nr:uncharacterized protein LOC115078904 [Rhinatrema bivittatum]
MGVAESVLCLEILRNMLNALVFPLLRKSRQSIGTYSILILTLTDVLITGSLLLLWASACLEDGGLDSLSLRFLAFQNQMYNALLLPLPGLLLSEGLCSACCLGQSLPMLDSLFTLSCWLVGASYGSRDYLQGVLQGELCPDQGKAHCRVSNCLPLPSPPDALLLSISLLLVATYVCSRLGHPERPQPSRVCKATSWNLLWMGVVPFLCWVAPFWGLSGPLILGLGSVFPNGRLQTDPAAGEDSV